MKIINLVFTVIFLFSSLKTDNLYVRPDNYTLLLAFISGFTLGAINGSVECKNKKNKAALFITTLVANDLLLQRKIGEMAPKSNITIIENKTFKKVDAFFWYSSPMQAIVSIGAYGLGNLVGIWIKNINKDS